MRKLSFLTFFIILFSLSFAQIKPFVVVIDAGHGGHDKGAIGSTKYAIYEKNITLDVSKRLGKLIKDRYGSNVKVIYTRTSDKFITLKGRANIANRNHADLFISIHCNSNAKTSPYGSETYVLGLHRSADNFEVAKRENSVILLEEDYKVTYEGFDPNSPESVIGLTLMQDAHLDQSIEFADDVQKHFTNIGRKNRGVKQAGFLVLRETAMPSVLIEIGFVSNAAERQFINSSKGKSKIAKSIFQSFDSYKKEFDKKNGVVIASSSTNTANNNTQVTSKEGIVYKVQLMSSKKWINKKSSNFKGLQDIERVQNDNGIYIYTYGKTSSYSAIKKKQKEARGKGYKDCFIIALKNGERVSVKSTL
ncbi:N-acetylmuramoyl-L-alanine amidase [Flavobacteriaceae bacterium UJ101]|nr:N-acetylmuramoyl-L-alanine amidase [Flavobacteriaceae bacterium UJ101]